MRLNMDCIRDILLCIEEHTGLRQYCNFIDLGLSASAIFVDEEIEPKDYQKKLLEKYSNDILIYHLNYCAETNLIDLAEIGDQYNIIISDLTPSGHEFLANIRKDTVWNNVKEVSRKVGTDSLPAIIQIAASTVAQQIKNQFGII